VHAHYDERALGCARVMTSVNWQTGAYGELTMANRSMAKHCIPGCLDSEIVWGSARPVQESQLDRENFYLTIERAQTIKCGLSWYTFHWLIEG